MVVLAHLCPFFIMGLIIAIAWAKSKPKDKQMACFAVAGLLLMSGFVPVRMVEKDIIPDHVLHDSTYVVAIVADKSYMTTDARVVSANALTHDVRVRHRYPRTALGIPVLSMEKYEVVIDRDAWLPRIMKVPSEIFEELRRNNSR